MSQKNKIKKRKSVAFPMMGNVYIPVKTILKKLGAKVVLPPENNKTTLDLGVKNSIEGICFPYKLNLGNYIQALNLGADTLLMFQAPGTCRFGTYTITASHVLEKMGYKFEMVLFDMYKEQMKEVIKKFSYVAQTKNPLKIINAFRLGFKKFYALDKIEIKLFKTRPRELHRGNSEKIYKKARKLIDKAENSRELRKIMKKVMDEFDKVEIDREKDVPIVYLTGEFFVLLDPFTNMDIEKTLGELGIEVQRQIMLSDWLEHVLTPHLYYKKESHRERSTKYAAEFMKRAIGGECIESIGDAVFAARHNANGLIHLSPFTCNPEIVTQNILPKVSEHEDIPVMSLILDEFTGRAGYITRIEAFADLIKRKKTKKKMLIKA